MVTVVNTIAAGNASTKKPVVLSFKSEAEAKAACPEGYFVDVLVRDADTLEAMSYCVKRVARENDAARGFDYLTA